MVIVRETARSVAIVTPSTLRFPTVEVPVSEGVTARALAGHAGVSAAQVEEVVARGGERAHGGPEVDRAEAGHATTGGVGSGRPGRPGTSGTRRSPSPASAVTRWPAGRVASPSALVRANRRPR